MMLSHLPSERLQPRHLQHDFWVIAAQLGDEGSILLEFFIVFVCILAGLVKVENDVTCPMALATLRLRQCSFGTIVS